MKTKSGPTLRNNRLLNKQKNRRTDACRRCTTAAKWVAGKTLEDERLKLNEELVELQDAQMNLEQFIARNREKNDRMERGMQMVAIERIKTLELPSRLWEEDRRCREAETAGARRHHEEERRAEEERRRKEEAAKAEAARQRQEQIYRKRLEEWLATKKFHEFVTVRDGMRHLVKSSWLEVLERRTRIETV